MSLTKHTSSSRSNGTSATVPVTDRRWGFYQSSRFCSRAYSLVDDEEYGDGSLHSPYFEQDWVAQKLRERVSADIMKGIHNLAMRGVPGGDPGLARRVRLLYCEEGVDIHGVPSIELLSRIYSPTSPCYVDVHLYWVQHDASRSTEECSLGYRVCQTPTHDDATRDAIQTIIQTFCGLKPREMHHQGGWRNFLWTITSGGSLFSNSLKVMTVEDATEIFQLFCSPFAVVPNPSNGRWVVDVAMDVLNVALGKIRK